MAEYAAVVEAITNGAVELDNGQVLLASALVPVATGGVWLPVAGFTDHCRVSPHGKVVSLQFKRTKRARLLRPSGPSRYPSVTLYSEATVAQAGLNRLVAQHFLPLPADARKTFVVPLDGNHLNLRAENLQRVFPGGAADEATTAYLYRSGERHHRSRLSTAEGRPRCRPRLSASPRFRATAARQIQSAATPGVRWAAATPRLPGLFAAPPAAGLPHIRASVFCRRGAEMQRVGYERGSTCGRALRRDSRMPARKSRPKRVISQRHLAGNRNKIMMRCKY